MFSGTKKLDNATETNQQKIKRANYTQPQPPPVNVRVRDYIRFISLIKSVTDKDFRVSALNNGMRKVNVLGFDDYRNLTHQLESERLQ